MTLLLLHRSVWSGAPVVFEVEFSQPVTGFTASDVILSGTALPTTAEVVGSGANYSVTVTGMTVTGTVIASIPAGIAQNADGDGNLASTSIDNEADWIEPSVPPPSSIVGQYVLPQMSGGAPAGGDPFLSGMMVTGRTLLTLEQGGTQPGELWKIDLDNPGITGEAANVTRMALTGMAAGSSVWAGHNTAGVATGGDLWARAVNNPGERLVRISASTGAVTSFVSLPTGSYYTLGTDTSLYDSDGANSVRRIDPAGPSIVASSPNLAGGAGILVMDATNGILWSLANTKLTGLDPTTLAVVKTAITLPSGGLNHSPSVDAEGIYLYAVDSANGAIYRVTISDMSVTTFPAVVTPTTNHEESPSIIIGDKLYAWHKWVELSTQDVLAKVDLDTMTVDALITGMLDTRFCAYNHAHWDGTHLWILGRNVTGGNSSDALIQLW